MQKIPAAALIPMDIFTGDFALQIQLAYARDEAPNIFGPIYRDDARLWLHEDLARIVLLAARKAAQDGYTLILYDGLRTTDAQEKMAASPIVQENPQWMEEPHRLLSPPGKGAHPRGMAIDCSLLDEAGNLLDMGTVFDLLAEIPTEAHNPAHRRFANLQETHAHNRERLDGYLTSAAEALETPLYLLDTEWWDFRLPADIYEDYAPLSDGELPDHMRMVSGSGANEKEDEEKKSRLLNSLERFAKA